MTASEAILSSTLEVTRVEELPRQGDLVVSSQGSRRRRTVQLAIPLTVVLVVAVAHAFNMFHSPALFDDEGTYDSEAWALLHHGTLSHYTYWYDHPPLGWMTLAGWYLITLAYPLHLNLFDAGRLMMLACTVASSALLYVLVRRLGGRAWAAAIAVLLFGLTPLGLVWERETLLDNIATPFLIGAFVLALSPNRRLVAAVGAASALAGAILVKETSVLFAPFLAWQMWQVCDPARRRITMWLAGAVGLLILALYPTYALIKGELFPGKNHVSLTWALWWQLAERKGGGSELSPHSPTQEAVVSWLHSDWPLLVGAAACAVIALSTSRYRPLACTMLLLVVLPIRPGYLPAPYIIGMLWPAGTVIGLAADRLVPKAIGKRSFPLPKFDRIVRRSWFTAGVVLLVASTALVVGRDVRLDETAWSSDPVGTQEAAYSWVDSHVPRGSMVVVDNSAWLYLVTRGFPEETTLWSPKVDLDPAVKKRLPQGWKSIDYVVDSPVLRDTDAQSPIVEAALAHGQVIATFGNGADTQIRVLRVILPSGQ
jgi:hypothetical protein